MSHEDKIKSLLDSDCAIYIVLTKDIRYYNVSYKDKVIASEVSFRKTIKLAYLTMKLDYLS